MWTTGGWRDAGRLWIASAYAIHAGRVLLVHHNRFGKWVPPGGHVEPGESLSQAAVREFEEETGLTAEVISASPGLHPPDDNATPDAAPFYVDLEREGFRKPAIVHFFYVRITSTVRDLSRFQRAELTDIAFVSVRELEDLDTFEQVRSVAAFVLANHPDR